MASANRPASSLTWRWLRSAAAITRAPKPLTSRAITGASSRVARARGQSSQSIVANTASSCRALGRVSWIVL